PKARDVAERFEQLLAYASLLLSRQLGIRVRPQVARKEASDPESRLVAQTTELAMTGRLSGKLAIPNAIDALALTVDLRAGRVECSVVVDAPDSARNQTKLNWLLRQLDTAPSDLRVEAIVARARQAGPSVSCADLRADPKKLGVDSAADLRAFRLMVSRSSGSKRGAGRGSFISSVTGLVNSFYLDVVQTLKPWTAPPPQVKASPKPGTGPGTSTPLAQVDQAALTSQAPAAASPVSVNEPPRIELTRPPAVVDAVPAAAADGASEPAPDGV
ncbi:MAG: stress response protein, partial [Acidimicrobiales bacterium]|nr:stress response protein [Acidimicrobiales bacterium]